MLYPETNAYPMRAWLRSGALRRARGSRRSSPEGRAAGAVGCAVVVMTVPYSAMV